MDLNMPTPQVTLISTYHGHADRINRLTWAPDNTRIATASEDATVQVWSISSWKIHCIWRMGQDSPGVAAVMKKDEIYD